MVNIRYIFCLSVVLSFTSITLLGCSSFDLMKGGLQVSSDARLVRYEPALNNGQVCLDIKGNHEWCFHKRSQFKNLIADVSKPRTNIKANCNEIQQLPNVNFQCDFSIQTAGPAAASASPEDAIWSEPKCYWLAENGKHRSCEEIEPAVTKYVAQKKLEERLSAEKQRLAEEEKKAQKLAMQEQCRLNTRNLVRNLSEGDYVLQGLVIETKDKIVMVQSSSKTRWIKKSLILAPSCR